MPKKALTTESGAIKELPTTGQLLFGGGLVRESLSAGETETIPTGYQLAVHGDFAVEGTLNVEGKLVML